MDGYKMDIQAIWHQSYVYSSQYDVSLRHGYDNEIPFDGGLYTHAYTYPDSASEDNPAPLILFFHGWGSSSSVCGNSSDTATKRGYATIAMTGIGEKYGELNSWMGLALLLVILVRLYQKLW
jgi:hypothetical protein